MPSATSPPARATGVTGGAEIAVADAAAATGTQSLRFLDAPDLPQRWHPHLFYSLDLRRGEDVSRFDLRRGAEAELFIEWRDRASSGIGQSTSGVSGDWKLSSVCGCWGSGVRSCVEGECSCVGGACWGSTGAC